MDDELRHRILRILVEHPEVNQRELASILGVSLGKTNYCLAALIEKGWIKARNFKNNRNKFAYAYYLTPQGIEEKARLTLRFFRRKLREYEELKSQIDELAAEAETAQQMFPELERG
ncbi:MAG: MarR family EPS-associated transcriptional regulator [Leptospirales bacterium]|nr:MarR family EPS-associated transcriptional regulator [Leptospirales bacterium]